MLHNFVQNNRPFNWVKKGIIPIKAYENYTHKSLPTTIHYRDNIFVLAFVQRNEMGKSHTFLTKIAVENESIKILEEPKKALCPGKIGSFDMDGAISCCFITHQGKTYLYYCGWQNLLGGLWSCNTGRAILDFDSLSLQREFDGPVVSANPMNSTCATATVFYHVGDVMHTLYNSILEWTEQEGGSLRPLYGLHHATSIDGVRWNYSKELCIPFADEYEYAFGRPSVLFEDGVYYLWFACRATKNTSTYRMGFAHSVDGINWARNDKISGIDVSLSGWDSEMICYPCVFKHENRYYMLYNGNDYGKTGIGLAVLEED